MEQAAETDYAYIGLHKKGENWVWTDDTPVDFTDGWGEINVNTGDCAVLSKAGDWSSVNCSSQQNFNCKFSSCKLLQ